MSNPAALVQKLWNYCNILRDDGLSYGDYVEQLTFLLFLKMADEQSRPPYNKPSPIPKEFDWQSLLRLSGDALEVHYRHVLDQLGKETGMLGLIFRKAQNKIQDPAKLQRLIIDLIDREKWSMLSTDVKGDAYEGLLQKNAEDVKGGAGQYFTPRPLIAAIVECMAPRIGETVCDPACGTGGFLLAAYDYIANDPSLDRDQKRLLKNGTLHGVELVDSVTRLCAMNLLLHGIGDNAITDTDATKEAAAKGSTTEPKPRPSVGEVGERSEPGEGDSEITNMRSTASSDPTANPRLSGQTEPGPTQATQREGAAKPKPRPSVGEVGERSEPGEGGSETVSTRSTAQQLPVQTRDALAGKHGEFDMVLTNPPFGRKSSVTIVNEAGEQAKESLTISRDDFWATTSNKQLNFVQHVFTILKQHGRAAVVVPDNVLFEGGAGETVRRKLLQQADVHTLLRLPTGIFYAQGVKANVIFFDRKPASEHPWTKTLWIYDLRTNKDFTLKTKQLKPEDLNDFVTCYNPANRHNRKATWHEDEDKSTPNSRDSKLDAARAAGNGRWREYRYEDLVARDKANLDIIWLRDESLEDGANLPPPEVIAAEIVEDLQAALEQFAALAASPDAPL